MLRRTLMLTAAALCLVTGLVSPAAAAGPAPAPHPAPRAFVTPMQETDLKQECALHDAAAGSQRGWPRSRFEQCHHYHRHVNLYREDGEQLGYVEYDLWILAFAYDGDRRVDYVTSVENVKQTSTMADDLTYLTVTYNGCAGRQDVTCTGALERSDTFAGWYATPTMQVITVTSPDGVGVAPFAIVNFAAQVDTVVEYRDGRTIPYQEPTTAYNAVRFDSANSALGAGKFIGTVFIDYIPTLVLPLAGAGIDQEARHVNDALHHPERTFPSFVGKNVPGQNRPLHRLMDPVLRDTNHAAAVTICQDVWGPDYTSGGLECDEYPFKSTYEGAAVSTGGNPYNWNGSARPINGADNRLGGTLLGVFYGQNRVLDNDAFFVTTVP